MIDVKYLMELRRSSYRQGFFLSPLDFAKLHDAIERLWKVVHAAQGIEDLGAHHQLRSALDEINS